MALPGTHHEPSSPACVTAKAANNPAALTSQLFVTIDSWGAHEKWGPCAWAPRSPLPKVGNECLVAFDEHGNPWVVCWK